MKTNLYFIQSGRTGAIKIGVAEDVKKRQATLQTGNPQELFLVALIPCKSRSHAYGLESHFHKIFKKKRVRGEWFSPTINLSSLSELDSQDVRGIHETDEMEKLSEARKHI